MEVGAALDGTLDLFEADVVVDHVGVEGDFEVDVFISGDVALFGVDGEELLAEGSVPGEMGPDVAQVGQLQLLHQLAVDHHRPEA